MEDQNLSERKATIIDKLVSTGLGSGLSPVAPGTAGSLVGILIYLIPGFEKNQIIIPATAVFFFWGAFASGKMEKVYGHDPSRVVIDEIVGMWTSFVFLPKKIVVVVAAFLLFRLLDIIKPFPASRFDKNAGGLAIMLDDLTCGIYTNLLIQIYLRFF
ncbi:MAG TPA: phosphatidylglycerophosphatase A [Candidatus Kryptonia bacterium]